MGVVWAANDQTCSSSSRSFAATREHTEHVSIVGFVRLTLHHAGPPVPAKVASIVAEAYADAAAICCGGADFLRNMYAESTTTGAKTVPASYNT